MDQLTEQNQQEFERQQQETREIIEALLEDGSDPDALYSIEHHLSSTDRAALDAASLDAFQLGLDVYDIESLDLEDQEMLGFDIVFDCALDESTVDQQVAQMMLLAQKYNISYDGWGTYFEQEPFYSESDEPEQ